MQESAQGLSLTTSSRLLTPAFYPPVHVLPRITTVIWRIVVPALNFL